MQSRSYRTRRCASTLGLAQLHRACKAIAAAAVPSHELQIQARRMFDHVHRGLLDFGRAWDELLIAAERAGVRQAEAHAIIREAFAAVHAGAYAARFVGGAAGGVTP